MVHQIPIDAYSRAICYTKHRILNTEFWHLSSNYNKNHKMVNKIKEGNLQMAKYKVERYYYITAHTHKTCPVEKGLTVLHSTKYIKATLQLPILFCEILTNMSSNGV